ncbi:hypothetical protein [Amycolatopsis sulphurea]|nr:hypothetical protein [Amycolatopsis sulphurea]
MPADAPVFCGITDEAGDGSPRSSRQPGGWAGGRSNCARWTGFRSPS